MAFRDRQLHCIPSPSEDEPETLGARARYDHLTAVQQQEVEEVIKGHLTAELLPPLPPRVVRLYVTSTHTDFVEEKDALIQQTFPELKAYCREAYGIDFQAIDPRWCVPDATYPDHSTHALCLEELRASQQQSLGPSLLSLIGDRVGPHEPPACLPAPVYREVVALLVSYGEDVTLLNTWYKEDTNQRPDGAFILQPTPDVLGPEWEERQWHQLRGQMSELLRKGARLCVNTAQLSVENLAALVCPSGLEAEIRQSCQQVVDGTRSTITVSRRITDLADHTGHHIAPNFIDLYPDTNIPDDERSGALEGLHELCTEVSGEDNTLQSNVRWAPTTGIDVTTHKDHIDKVCRFVYQRCRYLIDAGMKTYANLITDDSLVKEIVSHWTIAKRHTELCLGRDDIFDFLKDYLVCKTTYPLILSGECGIGKTTMMSEVAFSAAGWLRSEGHTLNAVTTLRLCGMTPDSMQLRGIISSLCEQLVFTTGGSQALVPHSCREQIAFFKHILETGNFRGVLVVILDGIDRLSNMDDTHVLEWLPSKVANNVKLLLSASSTHNPHVLAALKAKYPDAFSHFQLDKLKPKVCLDIVVKRLLEEGKRMGDQQSRVVEKAVTQSRLPLHAHLVYGITKRWRSYDPIEDCEIPSTIQGCLEMILKHAEDKHGYLLVSHCVTFLSATPFGITEGELMDVLSLDEDVLDSLYSSREFHPRVRRFAEIFCLRLFSDIQDLLSYCDADGTTVMCWKHAAIADYMRKKYSDENTSKQIHSLMADFYLGTGSCVANPFSRATSANARHAQHPLRYIPTQPLAYASSHRTCDSSSADDGLHGCSNRRKLHYLPYHLRLSGRLQELYNNVLFNYEWLLTKLSACPLTEVLDTYEALRHTDKEVALVADALKMSHQTFEIDVRMLSSELLGRLIPYYDEYANIKRLLNQCDDLGHKVCMYTPHWQTYRTPGAPLRYIHDITLDGYTALSNNNSHIYLGCVDSKEHFNLLCKHHKQKTLHVWDIAKEITMSPYTVTHGDQIYPTIDGAFLNCFDTTAGLLKIYDYNSGRQVQEIDYGKPNRNIAQVALSDKYVAFTLDGQTTGPCVVDINVGGELIRLNYHARAIAISASNRYLACNHGTIINLLEFPILQKKYSVDLRLPPQSILFQADHTKLCVKTEGSTINEVSFNLIMKSAKVSKLLAGSVDFNDMVLSNDTKTLLAKATFSLVLVKLTTPPSRIDLREMPYGDFYEEQSPFVSAGFSNDDTLVIGARHRHLGVWDAKGGKPLRLLNFCPSPITSLYISKHRPMVLSVHSNKSMQLWSLDNLREFTEYCPVVQHAPVDLLAAAAEGNKILCGSSVSNDVQVFYNNTGRVQHVLRHPSSSGEKIRGVFVSPKGNLGVTFIRNHDIPQYAEESWDVTHEAVLWDLNTGRQIQTVTNVRYVVFSPDDMTIIFVPCVEYDLELSTSRVYSLISLDFRYDPPQRAIIDVPAGDICRKPLIVDHGKKMVFLHVDENMQTSMYMYSLDSEWDGLKCIQEQDILTNIADTDDRILDLELVDDNILAVILGKHLNKLPYDNIGVLDDFLVTKKSAILLNANGNPPKYMERYLMPETNLSNMNISQGQKFILDRYTLYHSFSGQKLKVLSHLRTASMDTAKQQTCFLCEGRYIAHISKSRKSVLIIRTSDGKLDTKIMTHGLTKVLSKVQDDRTLAIGCEDGRLMVVSLLLGEPDPVTQIVRKLPSRNPDSLRQPRGTSTPLTGVCMDLKPLTWREMMLAKKINIVQHVMDLTEFLS